MFALDSSKLGMTDVIYHAIDTGDQFTSRKKVEEMIKDMLDKKIIQPSKSPWASPVVLVAKKDGNVRFCVDYR